MEFTTASLLKAAHVLIAFWFVTGLVGRNLTLAQMNQSRETATLEALSCLAGRFERLMVQPGSILVLAAGIAAALHGGYPVLGFIEGADANWLLASLLLFVSAALMVPLVFVPRGRVFESALARCIEAGSIQPDLVAALKDPVVRAAHGYEMAAVIVVVFLMLTRPF